MSKNNRYYINVGATGYFKTVAGYSETGSSLLCVAPGGSDTALNPLGNKTSEFINDFGYPHLYISDSKISDGMGTSYACPMVTGCIALLLSHGDNNAKLSWRDVKELVSISCDNTIDPTSYADINTSIKNIWFTNGAGRKYNINYGFGLLDCKKLIDNSINWTLLPTQEYTWTSSINIQTSGKIITSEGIDFDTTITDAILKNGDDSVDVTKCRIENVQIIISTSGASEIHELDLRVKSPQCSHTVSCFNSSNK